MKPERQRQSCLTIRRTIAHYYVNQAVACGLPRGKVHAGSVTFIQRFGSALQLHVHSHVLVLEGVFLDRTDQGRTPRFLPGAPPTDTDIVAVVQQISRRVIRLLRRLGYLETGVEAPVATGYDPLRDTAPEPHHGRLHAAAHRLRGAGRPQGPAHWLRLWLRG